MRHSSILALALTALATVVACSSSSGGSSGPTYCGYIVSVRCSVNGSGHTTNTFQCDPDDACNYTDKDMNNPATDCNTTEFGNGVVHGEPSCASAEAHFYPDAGADDAGAD